LWCGYLTRQYCNSIKLNSCGADILPANTVIQSMEMCFISRRGAESFWGNPTPTIWEIN
jgi:hypothetical protein